MSELAQLPIAFGNEEETGMLELGYAEEEKRAWKIPYELIDQLETFIPKEVPHSSGSNGYFLKNGGFVYGTASDALIRNTIVERTTAEHSTFEQMPAAIAAHERLAVNIAGNYALVMTKAFDMPIKLRLQRRTIDSEKNTWGCHDNFGFDSTKLSHRTFITLKNLAVCDSFLFGAGYITPKHNNLFLSQKKSKCQSVIGYSFSNSLFRDAGISGEDDTGPRLERRYNDVNISPWAIKHRFAIVGLAIAASSAEGMDEPVDYNGSTLDLVRSFGRISLNPDGSVTAKNHNWVSVDFVDKLIDNALELGPKNYDLPIEYELAADSIKQFCQDFRKVLSGEAAIDLLADRADYAAKFNKIVKSAEQDTKEGTPRKLNDIKAQAQDLLYDYIGINANPGAVKPQVTYGYGYRLRNKNGFRDIPSPAAVDQAYLHAPRDTRAHVRSLIVGDKRFDYIEWNKATFSDARSVELYDFGEVLNNTPSYELMRRLNPKASK